MTHPAEVEFRQRMILCADLAEVVAEHVWNLSRPMLADGEKFSAVGGEDVPGYENNNEAILLRRESDGRFFEVDVDVFVRLIPTEAEMAERAGQLRLPGGTGVSEKPAETLRRAAKLMRERAEAATPGPWHTHDQNGDWYVISDSFGQVSTGLNEEPSLPEFLMIERDRRDAEYIAAAHPLVGLALADWLEAEAERAESRPDLTLHSLSPGPLATARAYLGEVQA